jgi:hypothetical protein
MYITKPNAPHHLRRKHYLTVHNFATIPSEFFPLFFLHVAGVAIPANLSKLCLKLSRNWLRKTFLFNPQIIFILGKVRRYNPFFFPPSRHLRVSDSVIHLKILYELLYLHSPTPLLGLSIFEYSKFSNLFLCGVVQGSERKAESIEIARR